MMVGREVEIASTAGTEGVSSTFPASKLAEEDSGATATTGVDSPSTLASCNPVAPVASFALNSDNPGISVSVFAIDAS